MAADIPLACALSGPELREREQTVLQAFGHQVRSVQPRPDGYSIEVAATAEGIAAATALIDVERRCCPFLRFDLTVEADGGPVHLSLTGGPGVRDFLAAWLQARTPRAAEGSA